MPSLRHEAWLGETGWPSCGWGFSKTGWPSVSHRRSGGRGVKGLGTTRRGATTTRTSLHCMDAWRTAMQSKDAQRRHCTISLVSASLLKLWFLHPCSEIASIYACIYVWTCIQSYIHVYVLITVGMLESKLRIDVLLLWWYISDELIALMVHWVRKKESEFCTAVSCIFLIYLPYLLLIYITNCLGICNDMGNNFETIWVFQILLTY